MKPHSGTAQTSPKNSQKTKSGKDVDARQEKGEGFELEVYQLLRSHNLLPNNVAQKKSQYPFGTCLF